jgi:hypothetical protein
MLQIIMILGGAAMLFLGQELFWVFLAAAGFGLGAQLAWLMSSGSAQAMIWLFAIAGGILGVVLAIFFQFAAIALLGLSCGAYFAYSIPNIFGYEPLAAYWVVVWIGGLIGAILSVVFFGWALAIFTALSGASLIVQAIPATFFVRTVIFVVLVSVGIAYQSASLRKKKKEVKDK